MTAKRIMLTLVAGIAAHAAAAKPMPAVSETVFRDLIATRLAAVSLGDWAAYQRLIAPDFVHVSDLGRRRTGGELRTYIATLAGNHAKHDVASLSWRSAGSWVIVDADVREHLPDLEAAWHETDVFAARSGRWLMIHHQETPVPQPPTAEIAGGAPVADYIGRYRSASGTEDLFAVSDGKLAVRAAPGDPPTALIQVAPGVFAVAGDPQIVSFVRDRDGRVTGCVWHLLSGQVTSSKRIE